MLRNDGLLCLMVVVVVLIIGYCSCLVCFVIDYE